VSDRRSVVRVTIVGEEYSIRSDASADHTRAVAQYVDQAIRKVMATAGVVETQRAAILAMLQITDELFKVRSASESLGDSMRELTADVRRLLPPAKRAEARVDSGPASRADGAAPAG
jgi:cell division protein ZapA